MSKATKRKHVTKEVLDQYVLPEGKKEIVKVIMDYLNHVTLLLIIAWQLDAVWLYPQDFPPGDLHHFGTLWTLLRMYPEGHLNGCIANGMYIFFGGTSVKVFNKAQMM